MGHIPSENGKNSLTNNERHETSNVGRIRSTASQTIIKNSTSRHTMLKLWHNRTKRKNCQRKKKPYEGITSRQERNNRNLKTVE